MKKTIFFIFLLLGIFNFSTLFGFGLATSNAEIKIGSHYSTYTQTVNEELNYTSMQTPNSYSERRARYAQETFLEAPYGLLDGGYYFTMGSATTKTLTVVDGLDYDNGDWSGYEGWFESKALEVYADSKDISIYLRPFSYASTTDVKFGTIFYPNQLDTSQYQFYRVLLYRDSTHNVEFQLLFKGWSDMYMRIYCPNTSLYTDTNHYSLQDGYPIYFYCSYTTSNVAKCEIASTYDGIAYSYTKTGITNGPTSLQYAMIVGGSSTATYTTNLSIFAWDTNYNIAMGSPSGWGYGVSQTDSYYSSARILMSYPIGLKSYDTFEYSGFPNNITYDCNSSVEITNAKSAVIGGYNYYQKTKPRYYEQNAKVLTFNNLTECNITANRYISDTEDFLYLINFIDIVDIVGKTGYWALNLSFGPNYSISMETLNQQYMLYSAWNRTKQQISQTAFTTTANITRQIMFGVGRYENRTVWYVQYDYKVYQMESFWDNSSNFTTETPVLSIKNYNTLGNTPLGNYIKLLGIWVNKTTAVSYGNWEINYTYGETGDEDWSSWTDSSGANCLKDVVDIYGRENVMELYDNNPASNIALGYNTFTNQINYVYHFDIYKNSTSPSYIYFYTTGSIVYFRLKIDNNISYFTGIAYNIITDCAIDMWHSITVYANVFTDTVRIVMDDILLEYGGSFDIPFVAPMATYPSYFYFITSSSASNYYTWFTNIKAYSLIGYEINYRPFIYQIYRPISNAFTVNFTYPTLFGYTTFYHIIGGLNVSLTLNSFTGIGAKVLNVYFAFSNGSDSLNYPSDVFDQYFPDLIFYYTQYDDYAVDITDSAYLWGWDGETLSYTLTWVVGWIFYYTQEPPTFFETLFQLITPLMLIIVFPIAFYQRFKGKGAAVGFILGFIVMGIANIVSLPLAIILTGASLILSIILFKAKGVYDGN